MTMALTKVEAEEYEKQLAREIADKRTRDWQHKQHLDSLNTFSEKLNYYVENVNSYPSSITYMDGENILFTVGVKPETEKDRRELYRTMMDCHRNEMAESKEPVRKLGWQYSVEDPQPIAFEVQLLNTLKKELQSRLSTSIRKKEFLEREIELTTAKINSAGLPLTEELRSILETNRTYDFAFIDKPFSTPSQMACRLAYVWDIIHYEAYLKDELAALQDRIPYVEIPALTTSIVLDNVGKANKFNSVPLEDIKRYFGQLAENNSSNGKPFLTFDQIEQFIERAFIGNNDIPELTFNLQKGERTSIVKLFYQFYQRCTNDYSKEPTKHCKEKYVKLLTDNFTNYNFETVFANFNNSKNAPKDWE